MDTQHNLITLIALLLFTVSMVNAQNRFPDGTPIPSWFSETQSLRLDDLGKKYTLTDYCVVNDSTVLQTEKIQAVIDKAAQEGGGVIIIPKGTFLSGSLFFKPKTHLYIEEGAVLKGSDDISDFPVIETRIEGETCQYFPALVNADHVDGFTLSGKGTINGNGLRYWKAFWLRRAWNPQCTNKDEMRPRLLYVSNSKNVQISGIKLINSPFWTSHYYKCENVKLLNLMFLSPEKPVKAPSTDAIDIDVCKNVLVKNCYMAVNDDAIALKGGKGPKADKDENNGGNYNIIIEDCTFGLSHSSLTCGSESIHDRNIIVRNCKLEGVRQLLHLKMRPDTPQNYEYILIENVTGTCGSFLSVRPWTQFFDIKGEEKMPVSYSSNITFRNIDVTCDTFFGVVDSEQYRLSDFTFENLNITAKNNTEINTKSIQNMIIRNVSVNGKKIK